MSDKTARKVRTLNQQLRPLSQQLDTFNKEAKQWAEKRDMVHKQIKDLRMEATYARKRRDSMNAKVKELKTQRDQTRIRIKKKIEKTNQLKEKIRLLTNKKPRQAVQAIRKEKEEIEWKIQTTSLSLQEEKPFVERANQLGIQLNTYKQINDTKEDIIELQNKIRTLAEKARLSHTQLSELAYQSQELHNKMLEIISKIKMLQIKADNYHQTFLQSKEKSIKVQDECIAVEKEINALKKELTESEKEERILRQKETQRKLKSEALKKLKQGEKLTLKEFKLLAEEEKT